MRDFSYSVASRPEEALSGLSQPDCMALAGGTELLNWMRLGIVAPDRVVDISRMDGQSQIRLDGDRLTIGALATLNQVGEDPAVRERASALSEACLKAASAQVRHRATLGGNVLQKTRCAYFRSEAPLPWGCNKREPGSGCAARDGLNERHAIFGWTDACIATHPSDPAVALACLDADVEIVGPRGRRLVPMTAFHFSQTEARSAGSAPGLDDRSAREAQIETQLEPDELLLAYHLEVPSGGRSSYIKVRERESFEYALVSAAAAVDVMGGVIQRVRVALGSVAQKPWRLTAAEMALVGRRPTSEEVLPAVRAAMAEARPLKHNGFKVQLAANAATRAIVIAGSRP